MTPRFVFCLLVLVSLWAGARETPKEAKVGTDSTATLYITRISNMGALINFRFFVDGRFVGKFNAGKYLKLELPPGEHRIYAGAENISIMDVNLKTGNTYILDAQARIGAIKSAVKLRPVTGEDPKLLAKAGKYIQNKKQVIPTEEELAEGREKFGWLLEQATAKYERKKKKGKLGTVFDKPVPPGFLTDQYP